MQLQKLLHALILLSLVAPPVTIAAVDGQIGESSTGRVVIRLDLIQGIQISNLQDIEISVSGQATEFASLGDEIEEGLPSSQVKFVGGDIVSRHRFCVRGNTGGNYTITAFSDRAGSAPFSLFSANNDEIDFEIYFRGDLSKQVGDRLMPNIASRQYSLENKGANCDGQNNAEMSLVFPASEINQASDREYSGFLNLTVAIE
jgi:hypothetical protein